MKFQDVIAGAMAIILLLAIITFSLMQIETPEELKLAFGVSIGWVFSRAINGKVHGLQKEHTNGD